jgi:3-deoxy-D-manno-octulosonic-acid transferase
MLHCFSHLFVQDEGSLQALNTIGFTTNITVSGDTRFDRVIAIAENFEPIESIQKFCGNDKVIVAGSTWEEDEAELIHYVRANPLMKFIIAPHSTDSENLKDIRKEFAHSIFYSEMNATTEGFNVLIIDNVGMLSRLYKYATITYVGGAFTDNGVHNVLEAAVYGKPVIYGPEYEKYLEAIELIDCEGAISINNALELEAVFNKLLADENELKNMCDASEEYVYGKAGATKKIVEYIYANRLLTN